MKGNFFSVSVLFLCLLLITGCSTEVTDKKQEDIAASKETDNYDKTQDNQKINEDELDKSDIEKPKADTDQVKSTNPIGDYHVVLGGEVIETEDKILIKGTSNLIPGSRVVGTVWVEDNAYLADTTELVQEDGSFYMELAHHKLNEVTYVSVKFHFDSPQDDAIKRHYGDRGQKLEGPYIYKHQRAAGGRSPKDIYQKAEAITSFKPGKEMAIREFKEPEMYPIPEDIGSPRVWIEVDDITNDKEFFYLHGRSNLIEGSRIRGSYYYKHDEAYIKPDGSFGLKIEYEYREKTPFIISFEPDNLQWNMVEEVYGKEGQNLLGELVVVNEFNKHQSIEKKVELKSTEINVPDNVELSIDGTEVKMLVPDHLLFDFDQHALKSDAKNTLVAISKTLQSFDKQVDIVINGHTDNVGDTAYNLKLSEKRAESVKTFLMNQGNEKEMKFTIQGYGETKPIASNDDEAGRAKNRRVEIVVNLRDN